MRKIFGLLALLLTITIQSYAYEATRLQDREDSKSVYHLSVSDSHKFVWFRVAKVGTRSLTEIFHRYQLISAEASNVPYQSTDYAGYFKFAFVRNPWDRVVSAYMNKVKNQSHYAFRSCFGKPFEYFVETFINGLDLTNCDRHLQLQTHLIPVKDLHFIGRFERFNADATLLLNALGIHDVEIPHKNMSAHEHYSHYYNERTKEIIARKYREDIETFGFQFEYK